MLKFFRKNVEAARIHGSLDQQNEMEGTVAQTSQLSGELSDFMGGVRKLKDNEHHTPKDLADRLIHGVIEITKIRREIGT